MCSYQSVSDTSYDNFTDEDWEELLWENLLSPDSNTSSTDTSHSQGSVTDVVTHSDRNSVPILQDYQASNTDVQTFNDRNSVPILQDYQVSKTDVLTYTNRNYVPIIQNYQASHIDVQTYSDRNAVPIIQNYQGSATGVQIYSDRNAVPISHDYQTSKTDVQTYSNTNTIPSVQHYQGSATGVQTYCNRNTVPIVPNYQESNTDVPTYFNNSNTAQFVQDYKGSASGVQTCCDRKFVPFVQDYKGSDAGVPTYSTINAVNFFSDYKESDAGVSTYSNRNAAIFFSDFKESDAGVPTFSDSNAVPITHNFQNQVPADNQNAELSPVLSPVWVGANVEIPHTSADNTMSACFSTFNPSGQFQDLSLRTSPVTNISNAHHVISNARHAIANVPKPQNNACNRTTHQARINLVSTGNGNFKAIVKRKRKRTMFTTEQVETLEQVFSKNPYVTREHRQLLVQLLQVNDKSVKVWFQNRRLKHKRGDDQHSQSGADMIDQMEAVEFQEFVSLDDPIHNDIVKVTDDTFNNNPSPVEIKPESNNSPIYEPISPASADENSWSANYAIWKQQDYDINDIMKELMS